MGYRMTCQKLLSNFHTNVCRRDRYNGPTQAFSEKSGYTPNVKLEYIDDLGRNMNEKVISFSLKKS